MHMSADTGSAARDDSAFFVRVGDAEVRLVAGGGFGGEVGSPHVGDGLADLGSDYVYRFGWVWVEGDDFGPDGGVVEGQLGAGISASRYGDCVHTQSLWNRLAAGMGGS